jgi:2-polyprenyl-3-methyl-5-hydroxy-6-metoxy-1,4-benzoquinol methylase
MERPAFELLRTIERSWWYQGRRYVVSRLLGRAPGQCRVLDWGAGFGGMYKTLAPYGTVVAYEPDKEAREIAKTQGYRVVHEDLEKAFTEKPDLIGLFDVLEHVEDDTALLTRLHTMLSSNGRLVITVPAFQFLWSAHDKAHHHYRRYSKASLITVLTEAGYRIEKIEYWNKLLFPIVALLRLVNIGGSEGLAPPPPLNVLLYALIRFERFLPLPFGLSIAVIALKNHP